MRSTSFRAPCYMDQDQDFLITSRKIFYKQFWDIKTGIQANGVVPKDYSNHSV